MTIDLDKSVRQNDERYAGSDWYGRISPAHQQGAFGSKCTRTLHTDHHTALARILNALWHTAEEADSIELWTRMVAWIRRVPTSYLQAFGSHHPNKLLHFESWEDYQVDATDRCKSCCDSRRECAPSDEVFQWAQEAFLALREAAARTQDPRYWPYLEIYTGFIQEVLDLFFPDRSELHEQWKSVREEVQAQAKSA